MLSSSLFALLALVSVAFAQPTIVIDCPGAGHGSRIHDTHGIARRASPSGCSVRCNPTGIAGRVLISQDSDSYGGEHYSCQYDLPAGGAAVGCLFHNHNYELSDYGDTFYYNDGDGTQEDCPATLQMACGGGAYARKRSTQRKPLDALLKREKMAVVPRELAERKKVWGRGKTA